MRDQDDRVDKRIEAAMNRMTEAIKDFKVEAEKSAERMRMEAEKSAERMRMEFKDLKVEAEKSAERMRMEAEKSFDTKWENLYLRLVVTLSGASLLLGPMILAGYELISGRILFRGNR